MGIMKLDLFKDIAYAAANQSTCCRLHVGAAIFNMTTKRVYSIGYNGTPHGFLHCNKLFDRENHKVHVSINGYLHIPLVYERENNWYLMSEPDLCRIHHEFSEKYELHAEQNAILNLLRTGAVVSEHLAILSTTAPCCNCAKLIAALGIKNVFYCEEYDRHDKNIWDYYDKLGLLVCKA